MEMHVIGLAVFFLCLSFPAVEHKIVLVGIIFFVFRMYMIRPPHSRAKLLHAACFSCITLLFAEYRLNGFGDFARFVFALLSLVIMILAKAADIRLNWVWGTSVFLFFAAA